MSDTDTAEILVELMRLLGAAIAGAVSLQLFIRDRQRRKKKNSVVPPPENCSRCGYPEKEKEKR